MTDSPKKKKWISDNTIMAGAKLNKNTDKTIIDYYGGKVTAQDVKAALLEYITNHPKNKQEEKQ